VKKRDFVELEMKLKLNTELLQQRDELIKVTFVSDLA
jgi:hypothetical protein